MSKLTKNDLKLIVKECLIEILAEGLVGNNTASLSERRELKSNLKNAKTLINESSTQQTRPSYLDKIHVNKSNSLNEEVQNAPNVTTSISKDPVMNSIFADTALTTLQSQGLANSGVNTQNSPRPFDQASRIVEASDPSELFGEVAQNWAHLAFN